MFVKRTSGDIVVDHEGDPVADIEVSYPSREGITVHVTYRYVTWRSETTDAGDRLTIWDADCFYPRAVYPARAWISVVVTRFYREGDDDIPEAET